MKVLMLGFEFPPRMSGGLGTACQGLARALSTAGTEVLFVVPTLEGVEQAGDVELVAADSVPLPEPEPEPDPESESESEPEPEPSAQIIEELSVSSPLTPYMDEEEYRERLESLRRRAAEAGRPQLVPPEERVFRSSSYGTDLQDEVGRYARAVVELVREREFGVIHAHDWMSFPAGILAKEITGKPLVCHVHSSEYERRPEGGETRPDPRIVELERRGLEAADRIVCVSRRAADALCERYDVPFAKVRVVHNGIETIELNPDALVSEPEASPTVLFLGRLTHQKGPEYFLEAAALVAARAPEVRFVVSGHGDLLPKLIEQTEELGLTESVEFTGFLEGEAREEAFRSARVYVMPSVAEPFGITPLEAMARNVPVIVSRQAGVGEVAHSVLKVDYWDTEALAERILAVLQRPALRDELIAQGRTEVDRLGWDGPARRITGIYEEVIA